MWRRVMRLAILRSSLGLYRVLNGLRVILGERPSQLKGLPVPGDVEYDSVAKSREDPEHLQETP